MTARSYTRNYTNLTDAIYVDLNERKECEKLAFILPVQLRFENQYYLIPHPPKS